MTAWDELKVVLARLHDVVDPDTGEVVGRFAGAQALPLVIFRVAPGQTEPVPLLIGTASRVPRLGYTVPPGRWESRPR